MQIYIEMLEELIQQYVFITNNKEKADIIKARDVTKEKLNKFRDFLTEEVSKIGQIC
jgi:hypothetical protein